MNMILYAKWQLINIKWIPCPCGHFFAYNSISSHMQTCCLLYYLISNIFSAAKK